LDTVVTIQCHYVTLQLSNAPPVITSPMFHRARKVSPPAARLDTGIKVDAPASLPDAVQIRLSTGSFTADPLLSSWSQCHLTLILSPKVRPAQIIQTNLLLQWIKRPLINGLNLVRSRTRRRKNTCGQTSRGALVSKAMTVHMCKSISG